MENLNQLVKRDDVDIQENFTDDADRVHVRYSGEKGAHYKIAALIHNRAIVNDAFEFLDIDWTYMPQNRSIVTNSFHFNEYKVAQEHHLVGSTTRNDYIVLSVPVTLRLYNAVFDIEIFIDLALSILGNDGSSFHIPTILENVSWPQFYCTDPEDSYHDARSVSKEVTIQTTAKSESYITQLIKDNCQNYRITKHPDNPNPDYNCITLSGDDAQLLRATLENYINNAGTEYSQAPIRSIFDEEDENRKFDVFDSIFESDPKRESTWSLEKVDNLVEGIRQKILANYDEEGRTHVEHWR